MLAVGCEIESSEGSKRPRQLEKEVIQVAERKHADSKRGRLLDVPMRDAVLVEQPDRLSTMNAPRWEAFWNRKAAPSCKDSSRYLAERFF